MHTPPLPAQYKGHRFPVAIIAHAMWLYFRFPLSYRQVEEILAARGITVSYETIREWCGKFGQTYANALQRRRAQPGDKWHLDEVFLKINGNGWATPPSPLFSRHPTEVSEVSARGHKPAQMPVKSRLLGRQKWLF